MTNTSMAEEVSGLFLVCLFREGEPTDACVKAEGVMHNVGFHPERLANARKRVAELLGKLPRKFFASGGGGASFLESPFLENGMQWGEQMTAEQLMLLGTALGFVSSPLPRDLWTVLPGGVPYFVVDDAAVAEALRAEESL